MLHLCEKKAQERENIVMSEVYPRGMVGEAEQSLKEGQKYMYMSRSSKHASNSQEGRSIGTHAEFAMPMKKEATYEL